MPAEVGRLPGAPGRWLLAAALSLALLVAGCGDDDPSPDDGATRTTIGAVAAVSEEGTWAHPNGDLANTRQARGPIDVATVSDLGVAWTVPITAAGQFGGYASTPIVVDDTVFAQDLSSNVQAIDLRSGEIRWERRYDSPSVGPNGLAVGDGRVYGATADSAFALDQTSGDELWRVRLTRNEREGIDMAPGYQEGIVYVSTVPGNARGFYRGDGVGVLWALDGESGNRLWRFNTVPENLWDPQFRDVNSGGGLWHPPAFDDEGAMFVSVANPAPWPGTEEQPWGQSRPGPNLFTNSLVKLDAASGDVEWYQQVLPHDIYDWDLHLPPILTEHEGRQLVLTGGKMGYVYAFDAGNGDKLWERQVGVHNGHDRDNELALAGRFERLQTPVTVWPGTLGGVETQMAVREDLVYVPIVDLPVTFETQERQRLDFTGGRGQMVALDIGTGEIEWTRRFSTPVYGAATVVNSLVFTTTFDGTLHALDADTGESAWSERLPAGTNATVAIAGDTLLTAASFPQGAGERAQIIAFRIGATGRPGEAAPQPVEDEGDRETTQGGAEQQAGAEGGGDETGGEEQAAAGGDEAAAGGGAPSAEGRTIFEANCAGCHTLAAAGAGGNVGPNLDEARPDAAATREKVVNGGGGMPAFGGRLGDEEIEAVSQYVASAAGGGGGNDTGADGAGGTP